MRHWTRGLQIIGWIMPFVLGAQSPSDPFSDRMIGSSTKDSLELIQKVPKPIDERLSYHEPESTDYKHWREGTDTLTIDLPFNALGYFKKNSLEKDRFYYSLPSNQGQSMNPLTFDPISEQNLIPTGKSFQLIQQKDIPYFDVKTPFTELSLENGTQEGYYLRTTFSQNILPEFNYTLRYVGLKSEGNYLSQVSDVGLLMASINYHTPNNRLKIGGNFTSQNVDNQENGGIRILDNFSSGTADFIQRGRIKVNLSNTDSYYHSKYLNLWQSYGLLKKKGSQVSFPLQISNRIENAYARYLYSEEEDSADSLFYEPSLALSKTFSQKRYIRWANTTRLQYQINSKIKINAGLKYQTHKFYEKQEAKEEAYKAQQIGAVGNMTAQWGKFNYQGDYEVLSGTDVMNTYRFDNQLTYQHPSFSLEISAKEEQRIPNLNLMYHKSDYTGLTYNHLMDFNPEKDRKIAIEIEVPVIKTKLRASQEKLANYVYLDSNYQVKQAEEDINISQIEIVNEFSYGRFHLNTRLMFQKIDQEDLLPLPDFIGRALFYYQSPLFENAAKGQVGIELHYFSKFNSRVFYPVLNEFALGKDGSEIGGVPLLDIFYNLQIKRMNLYFRAINVTSVLQRGNYYNFPGYPYKDLKFQLGVKWQFYN